MIVSAVLPHFLDGAWWLALLPTPTNHSYWAGELVCGCRPIWGEETPPTRRIAVPLGQTERSGNGAETTRPPRHGHDALAMQSPLGWKR